MFGCIVASRLVQTNLQQVDVNKYIFELADPASINHTVVFLLGTIPFEPGFAATVHFQWPESQQWQILGMLSNSKPSAVFRLRGSKPEAGPGAAMMEDAGTTSSGKPATLGISIEPIATVEQQMAQLRVAYAEAGPTSSNSTALVPLRGSTVVPNDAVLGVLQKVMENLYNFVTSFVSTPATNTIPLKAFEDWYTSTQRKLNMDPNFLRKA
ncbi:hypothetical protein H4R35_004696 [Dimargaris xerosporica]|nr:hypothetical protein H4R35_004696 [Dimargaris xerosporica]